MLHDALLILWDCSRPPAGQHLNAYNFTSPDDMEYYKNICEIAKCHHDIQNFAASTSFHSRKSQSAALLPCIGLYTQALSEGISEVLRSYKSTLMEVENQVINNHSYTLSYVYSNVEKYQGLFNTLNKLISTIIDRKLLGCQILNLVHRNILNGNEMVHDAILTIFVSINKVFLNQLCMWLLYGELKDPYNEFFVIHEHNDSGDHGVNISNTTSDKSLYSALQNSLLECGYNLNPALIPDFMPLSLAQEILFIGKTVILFGFDSKKLKRTNYMKNSSVINILQKCGSRDCRRFTMWEDKEAQFHEKINKLKDAHEFEVCKLRNLVMEIKECVTKHLWMVAVEEAQLLHELRLLKDFYLLGRGELFLELLRLSAHLLDRPTTRTGTRDLNHAFQLAARAVFLSNNADVERFSFELPYTKPEVSSADSTTSDNDSGTLADGWSSVILKYEFKWPLHLLLTPEVLARYNDMFRLLLRVKKTQHDLHQLWKTYKQSTSFAMCQLHNKLMFLMDNLQHYMQADVLETNFSRLMDAVNKTNDFEKLRKAHSAFLANILSQSFLFVNTSIEGENGMVECIDNPVFCNIMELLKLCYSFCSMSKAVSDRESEEYYIRAYSDRFNKLVKQLMQLLVSLRERPCGVYLARLLMRLDYNRWLSGEAQLTQSVTNMLR